jgi:hypothetical protein
MFCKAGFDIVGNIFYVIDYNSFFLFMYPGTLF